MYVMSGINHIFHPFVPAPSSACRSHARPVGSVGVQERIGIAMHLPWRFVLALRKEAFVTDA